MRDSPAPATTTLPEWTLRAVVAGVVFGVLFGAANAYLGLKAGLTVSTSIPIAVLSLLFFKLARRPHSSIPGGGPRADCRLGVVVGVGQLGICLHGGC
jgi:uncharacterized oligopeptide transporter (OPT) family protein